MISLDDLKHILNLLCCCGAFEDLVFETRVDENCETSNNLVVPLLTADHRNGIQDEQPGPKLSTSNILGFGEKDVTQNYELGDLLGEGAFGVVRRCRNKATGEWFACKTIEKRQIRRRADVEDIRREVQILMMLSSHPNVAGLLTLFEDADAVHLILELCEGGQVFDHILDHGAVTEQSIAKIFKQMVQVVDHCHTLGIAHRDIKPENFLLSTKDERAQVKAADFGLSQFFTVGKNFRSLVGSAFYVAPEVLNRSYGPKADIWSLGVCLYVLLSGSPPFNGTGENDIFDKILYSEPDLTKSTWSKVSSSAKILISKMLNKNPDARPDAKEILQHRWLCEHAPEKPLGPLLIQRLRHFAGVTKVKHEALVAATQALEAGASPAMLDMVSKEAQSCGRKLLLDDINDLLGSNSIKASSPVLRSLVKFSAAQIGCLSAEDCVAAALGRSEARRDEFVERLYQKFDESHSNKMPFDNFKRVLSAFGSSEEEVPDEQVDTMEINEFNSWLVRNQKTVQKTAGFLTL